MPTNDIIKFITEHLMKNEQLRSLLLPLLSKGIGGIDTKALTDVVKNDGQMDVNEGQVKEALNHPDASQITDILKQFDPKMLEGLTGGGGFLSKILGMFMGKKK